MERQGQVLTDLVVFYDINEQEKSHSCQLSDVSKAFDMVSHSILLSKLEDKDVMGGLFNERGTGCKNIPREL